MSRLRVIASPDVVTGFHLAGVEAHGVQDVEAAETLLETWLDEREAALVAIEDGLLAALSPGLLRRLEASETVLYLAIPGALAGEVAVTRRARLARLLRRTIGVQISFGGEPDGSAGER